MSFCNLFYVFTVDAVVALLSMPELTYSPHRAEEQELGSLGLNYQQVVYIPNLLSNLNKLFNCFNEDPTSTLISNLKTGTTLLT